MGIDAVTGWLGMDSLLWAILRVALVWLAFHGAGALLLRWHILRKNFSLLPSVIAGMLVYMVLATLLSLLGVLSRTVVASAVAAGSVAGVLFLYRRLRKLPAKKIFQLKHPLLILPILLAGYLILTNLMLSARPEINFNDTQVTYLVQSDRWLNDGRMSFQDETVFSAYPMTSEMLLLLPSSLAQDRMDQLVLGQVFSHSLVIGLILLAMVILSFGWEWFPAGIIAIAGCSTILLWSHFAKPDANALFFVTVSLAILHRQTDGSDEKPDMSAFPVMSLALTSKFTAYLTLIPFGLMYLFLIRKTRPGWSFVVQSLLLTAALPIAFAIRTVFHTGTLFYPNPPFPSLLRPHWRMPELNLTYTVFNDRSSHFFPSIGFLENIYHYFGTWNSSIFFLLGGYLLSLKKKFLGRRTLILLGIGGYAAVSIVLFYPAWWGAKYGILLIPFAAFFGLRMLKNVRFGLAAATIVSVVVYFLYTSPLSPTEHWDMDFRNRLAVSYFTGEWSDSSTDFLEPQPELKATLWMNKHLPENSTILSFYVKKRYFSNHRWIMAWRYPSAAGLYLENSLEEEIGILEDLGVDYVILVMGSPAPFDDENSVELFARIGPGNILDPIASIDEHVICRFNPAAEYN